MPKTKRTAYSVAIKPAPDVREALRRTADAAGRTLTKEIELRLAASVHGEIGPSELYPGWPVEDQMRFRSLANIIGLLCARITLMHGCNSQTDVHKLNLHILGALEPAILELFKGLGAVKIDDQGERFFAMMARQLLLEIRQSPKISNPGGEKAALADFAKSWGVRTEEGE